MSSRVAVYGNYDYAIARDLDDRGCFYPTPKDREIGEGSVAWTLAHTDERSKRFMHDLPCDLRFELAGEARPARPWLTGPAPRVTGSQTLSAVRRRVASVALEGRA